MTVTYGLRDIEAEKSQVFWDKLSKLELEEALMAQSLNKKVAKNVILFLGDGMGISTITAGRIYKGQRRGIGSEETKLAMDRFPHAALSKTYSADHQVSDSAATATAFLCGVKTNYGMLGLTSAATRGICQNSTGHEVQSILINAAKAGKSTGVVTTTRIQHATPAGSYAHTPSRDWYGDAELSEEAKMNNCKDISMQFYESAEMITVAMGGGRRYMRPNTTADPEYPNKNNSRQDGNDLIDMWKDKMNSHGKTHQYVWNKAQFDEIDVDATDHILGLFEPKDMRYETMKFQDGAGEPSIAEMTVKAIEILRKNRNGYFLLVEGGRIDHGHHASSALFAMNEMVAFDDAIEAAVNMTSEEDTLIVTTADHSHVFTMGGYSERGNDILGLAPSNENPKKALDEKFYTTLLYGNGPGYQGHYTLLNNARLVTQLNYTKRRNVSASETVGIQFLQQTAVPLRSETHGGEDVAILARGPMAHLFHGVHEQNYIAYAMRYAACVGDDLRHCSGDENLPKDDDVIFLGTVVSTQIATTIMTVLFVIVIVLALTVTVFTLFCLTKRKTRNHKLGHPKL